MQVVGIKQLVDFLSLCKTPFLPDLKATFRCGSHLKNPARAAAGCVGNGCMSWIDHAIRNFSGDIPCGLRARFRRAQRTNRTGHDCDAARDPALYRTSINRARSWLATQQLATGSVHPIRKPQRLAGRHRLALIVESITQGTKSHDDNHDLSHSRASIQTEDLAAHINVPRAVDWLLSVRGNTMRQDSGVGHDVETPGWSWIVGTHTWLELTCMAVLALKAQGMWDHPRVRDGVKGFAIDCSLTADAITETQSCSVSELLPHIQPSGIALLALAGEGDSNGLVAKSIEYLHKVINDQTAAASLSYALLWFDGSRFHAGRCNGMA